MIEFLSCRSRILFAFLALVFLLFSHGLSDDSSGSKTGKDAESQTRKNTGSIVAIVFLVLVAVLLFSFFLFKLWQKKKREEQYARLLKLFEEDDELEVELGLRD